MRTQEYRKEPLPEHSCMEQQDEIKDQGEVVDSPEVIEVLLK